MLAEQLSQSVPQAQICVPGKTGDRAVPCRVQALEKKLPGIGRELRAMHRRIACADQMQDEESKYSRRILPAKVSHAICTLERSSQCSSTWTLREDMLLLKKALFDTEKTTEMR